MGSISKSVSFNGIAFPVAVYQKAVQIQQEVALREWRAALADGYRYMDPIPDEKGEPSSGVLSFHQMSLKSGNTQWGFDSIDDFWSEMLRPYDQLQLGVAGRGASQPRLSVTAYPHWADIRVEHPERHVVQRIMAPFEQYAAENPAPPYEDSSPEQKPRIFIGHGGQSQDWLILQNELQNVHKHDVEAFESGERAGHHIRSILEGFLAGNTFAVLVLSREDEQADSSFRARQNVVHEAGLFQGKLGFDRAVILVEKGTSLFSNLDGIQHIEYEPGQIRGAVGRLLAVIAREHPRANGGH